MTERFVTRQDDGGYRVIDTLTGEPAVIAMMPQTGLSEPDARHTANLLNQRAEVATLTAADTSDQPASR